MSGFATASAALFAKGAIPALPRVRACPVGMLGRGPCPAAYRLLSLALLARHVVAVRRADTVELWAGAPWQRRVTPLAMPRTFVRNVAAAFDAHLGASAAVHSRAA